MWSFSSAFYSKNNTRICYRRPPKVLNMSWNQWKYPYSYTQCRAAQDVIDNKPRFYCTKFSAVKPG